MKCGLRCYQIYNFCLNSCLQISFATKQRYFGNIFCCYLLKRVLHSTEILCNLIILPEDKRLSKIIWMNEALGTLIRNVESHIRIWKREEWEGLRIIKIRHLFLLRRFFLHLPNHHSSLRDAISTFVFPDRWVDHSTETKTFPSFCFVFVCFVTITNHQSTTDD